MKPSKMRANLIEFAEQARLSRVLVTLKEDCPLPDTLESFVIQDIPDAPLREFLTHHGFNSLLKKLGGGQALPQNPDVAGVPTPAIKVPKAPPIDRSAYECVQDMEALDKWIERAYQKGTLAVDVETDSLESVTARGGWRVPLPPARMKPAISRSVTAARICSQNPPNKSPPRKP